MSNVGPRTPSTAAANSSRPPANASDRSKQSTPKQHTIASQGAAAIATVTFYPFDVVRMRFMSQDGTVERMHNNRYYTSTVGSMRVIAREEGFRTLFRGAHVSVLGVIVSWGCYMMLYRFMVDAISEHFDSAPQLFSSSASSVVASATSAFIGSPIWMAKTRMQLEAVRGGTGERHYRTFVGSIRHTVETTGFRSLWRGVSAQMLLGIPNALMLPLYEWLKRHRMNSTGRHELRLWETAACSVTAKTAVAIVSHPILLIKTRLMDERSRQGAVQYRNLVGAVRTTLHREGAKGLFRGFVPGLCQTIPRNLLHFLLYESFLAYCV